MHERLIFDFDEFNLKFVGMRAIAFERVLADNRAEPLAMIGMNEYAVFHMGGPARTKSLQLTQIMIIYDFKASSAKRGNPSNES